MKVTSQMAGRWVKAAFLIILGIVILLYLDKFVDDLKTAFRDEITLVWTWDLLTILLWILVAWLFVDGALIIVLSFSEQRFTLADVMGRLDELERKLAPTRTKERAGVIPGPPVTETPPEEPPPPAND